MGRTATRERNTAETRVALSVDLDGTGAAEVGTGVGFLNHMLTLFAHHACIDLTVRADGDRHVDDHHTVEDVGIVLGQAVAEALGDKAGVRRYGHCVLPMDESLVTVAVDFCGRATLAWHVPLPTPTVGTFDAELAEEFWRGFSRESRSALHVLLHHGRNTHHVIEAVFKGVGRAVRQAVEPDPRRGGAVPSTKGTL